MIDNFVKNKDITDVFKKYMDKYMGKNYALDSIVNTIMITQGYVSYFCENYINEKNILFDNKKKFWTILEEYFYGTEDYFNNYS